ncbi:MAG: hypothetical protein KJ600_02960 [Nanoarchaeota archaeon]|nr:hypothetical protein [Nanoarchaeota archaeon]
MRKYRDYVYILFPKNYGQTVLLRVHLDDLIKEEMSLDDWEYFFGINETTGEAIWGDGLVRGQVSYSDTHELYIPSLDFDYSTQTTASIIWNPYLNRWLVSDVTRDYMWVAEDYWGPYRRIRDVDTPGSYNRFLHETLLGGNGREVYYAAAQYPSQRYGTYFYVADFEEPIEISLSQKSAIEGDVLEMVVADNSGGGQIDAFVDGNPAEFVSSEGNEHLFSYTLSRDENSGEEGVVKVLATNGTYSRDVALVVNRINGIEINITSHSDDDEVSGTILLEVDAHYEQEPLYLGEGKPEVYIIKTELSSECGFVEDADTYEPYSLKLDTNRFSDGEHYFKVTAYDTLDRRVEKIIRLNVNNPDRSPVEGNLVIDGDMEAENVSAWEVYNGAEVKKVQGVQKSGALSLLVVNNYEIDSPKGVEQTISGLSGGENLRLEAWIKIISYVFDGNVLDSKASVSVLDESGGTISYGEINPYGFFRRFTHEFVNPEENKNLRIVFSVKESNTGGAEKVEVLIDDVVLVNASTPLVDSPDGISVMSKNGENLIAWDKSESVNADYFYIYKKNSSEGDYERVQELESYRQSYLDGPGDFEENVSYYVTLVDFMGSESLPSELVSCPGNCSICGDGACEGIEDELNCPEDCFLPANDEELGTDGDNNNQGGDVDLLKECNDGIDNDADGFVDYPEDLGCNNLTDDSELEFGVTSANCTPLFECENWGDCVYNEMTRECYDINNCGSERRNETEECNLSDTPGGDTRGIKIFVGAVVAIAIGAAGLILRYWNKPKKKEYPVSTGF